MISLLYVDDETPLLELGKLFLEQNGQFRVDTITSAPAALALMKSKTYEAIISDYQMPGMDGIGFLQEIRKQSSIPFILFTGKGREEVVIEAINSGVTFYLQKGGDPTVQFAELAHKVRQAVKRARAETALKEKTGEIDKFFSASVDLLCIADTKGHFRRLNPAWERLLGHPVGELTGKRYLDFVHPDDQPATREALTRLSGQQAVLNFVNRYRSGDGSYRWIEWQAYPSGDLIYAAARDITDRKIAEEKFSTIYRNSPDIIWISELESGRFTEVNAAAERIFGYTREEFIGRTSLELGMWADPKERAALMERLYAERRVDRFRVHHLRKNGDVFDAESSVSTIILSGREYMIGTVRDISDIKRAEEAVREANKKLNLFSSITRHDIRNQISILRGYLAILKKMRPDPAHATLFGKVDAAAQRISDMIQFTKEYEEVGITVPAWQDIRTLVDAAAGQIPQGQVVVRNEIPYGTEVYADPLIARVFYNLMDNAVRYGGKITSIRFSVQDSGGCHTILCEDDGAGVPAEEKDQIFTREFGKNSGMGLFLAHEILAITGIMISEGGEPGTGTRFEIAVPEGAYRAAKPPA